MEFTGKNVVITGGARGMGKRFAVDFKVLGARPFVVDVVQENLDALRAETGIPGQILDVSKEGEVEAFFESYTDAHGAPDVLVNNAGITADSLFIKQKGDEVTKFPFANWERVLNVNLTGVFLCAREAAFQMLKHKMKVITGATSGIGLVTARELARLGGTTVILSRSPERCAAAVQSIRQETTNPAVDFIAADLSSQAQIRQAVNTFQGRYPRLHVLVNNVGGYFLRHHKSIDGIEMTWALNHLSYFLLTDLLLDTIQASAPARIVNVSSGAHQGGRIDFQRSAGQTVGFWLDDLRPVEAG